MHPLVTNLDQLTLEELEQKTFDLTRRFRSPCMVSVRDQLKLILDMYTEELETRRRKIMDEALSKRNISVDKLIKIS